MNTTNFFDYLKRRSDADAAIVAALRRSLAIDPGAFPAVYPLVEPFTNSLSERDRRTVYLAAGLWALAQRRESSSATSLAAAMGTLMRRSGSKSIESRFVALLDSDQDELIWRLRHVVSLTAAEGLALNWPDLLRDLMNWSAPSRFVQQKWAREFWKDFESADADLEEVSGSASVAAEAAE